MFPALSLLGGAVAVSVIASLNATERPRNYTDESFAYRCFFQIGTVVAVAEPGFALPAKSVIVNDDPPYIQIPAFRAKDLGRCKRDQAAALGHSTAGRYGVLTAGILPLNWEVPQDVIWTKAVLDCPSDVPSWQIAYVYDFNMRDCLVSRIPKRLHSHRIDCNIRTLQHVGVLLLPRCGFSGQFDLALASIPQLIGRTLQPSRSQPQTNGGESQNNSEHGHHGLVVVFNEGSPRIFQNDQTAKNRRALFWAILVIGILLAWVCYQAGTGPR